MGKYFLILLLTVTLQPHALFANTADDDELESGPSDNEVAIYKRSNLSITLFYSFANELEGNGTSSGAGADGQFNSFFETTGAFGIGFNYTTLRFWRMRMDLGLQIENGRKITHIKYKGETTTNTTHTSIDLDPVYTLLSNFYYPLARKVEIWAGINLTQLKLDEPNTSLDTDVGYQAGAAYNWTHRWTSEIGYYSKRVTGVTQGPPHYPYDHLKLNGFSLLVKYYY